MLRGFRRSKIWASCTKQRYCFIEYNYVNVGNISALGKRLIAFAEWSGWRTERIDFCMVPFVTSDRILLVAPHPDDEMLGAGGLLQRAFALNASVRILFGTNGEDNPWVQRYWERRWNIRAA